MFDITSMVDVVFILLAFFVLTAKFFDAERDVEIGASAMRGAGIVSGDLPPEILVRLAQLDGETVAISLGERMLPAGDFDALRDRIRDLDLPGVPVVLAIDPALDVQVAVRGLEAVQAGQARVVSFARLEGVHPQGDGQ
ncbi:MAG: biopolymer transporter ExbD [Phycisphaerales bacterium]